MLNINDDLSDFFFTQRKSFLNELCCISIFSQNIF